MYHSQEMAPTIISNFEFHGVEEFEFRIENFKRPLSTKFEPGPGCRVIHRIC